MPRVVSNGIEIAYEEHGKAGYPVLLLVQGLGMPLAAWPPMMIEMLVTAGFRVVTFDNRDIGESQYLDDAKSPPMWLQLLRRLVRLPVSAPYQLHDMMLDVVGLLDALKIESAHVVGVSMGGMISQLLTIHSPRRVRSLTSLMSTTGNRSLPGATREVTRLILKGPASPSDEDRLSYYRTLWRLLGSPAYPRVDGELERFVGRILERGVTTAGSMRQALAIIAAPSRVSELALLDVPTLVIHGDSDPLIPIEGGIDTAKAVPGARLETISGMGHDLPEALLPRIVEMIAGHADAADADAHRAVANSS